MIQIGSYLNVIDNSGAKKVACIRINASCKRRYAYSGDSVVVSVKSLRSTRRIFSKVKKGEVLNGLVIATKREKKDFFSNNFSFLENSVILLTRQNKLIGTRIFGGLPKRFRFTKYMKILSLSSGTLF
jgi:large subunit ribosomal protein L14